MSGFSLFFKVLKIVLSHSRERWYVFAVFLFRSFFYGIELVIPLLLAFVVDRLIPTADIDGLRIWLAVTIAFVIFSLAYLGLVVNYLFAKFDMYTSARMQSLLMRNLFNMKNYNYAKHSDGKLINVTQNDHADAVNMVYLFVTSGLIGIVSLAAVLIIIYNLSFAVFIAALCSLPFYVLLMFVNDKKVQHYQKLRLEANDKRQSTRKYIIEHMKQIKANGLAAMYEKHNDASIHSTARMHLKFLFWYFLTITLPNLVPKSAKYIAIFIGALGVINGQISLGVMLILTAYMEGLTAPMRDICQTVVKISSGKQIFERTLEVLESNDEADTYSDYLVPAEQGVYVDIENVAIANPGGGELFAINKLKICSNGIYQLAGQNGTGKTTFINLLTNASHSKGFKVREAGHVKISNLFEDNLAVFSAPFVFFPCTARTNILLGKEPPPDFDYIIRMLDIDFLDKEINPFNVDLSLGERTKITLARIFLQKRKIVILDEPFANLDIDTTQRAADYLVRLASDCLIIVVTHDEVLKNVRKQLFDINNGHLRNVAIC